MDIGDLVEREIRGCGFVGGNIRRLRSGQGIAHCADGYVVVTRLQPGGRESVVTLLIRDDGCCDGGTRFFGADQNALHRAFLSRAHSTLQSDRSRSGNGLRLDARGAQKCTREEGYWKAV